MHVVQRPVRPLGRPRLRRAWLVVASVIIGAGGIIWLAASAIALTAFGAPGTVVNLHAWLFVLSLWSYPFWGIAPLILAWMLRGRRPRASLVLSLLPFAIAAVAGILFWH